MSISLVPVSVWFDMMADQVQVEVCTGQDQRGAKTYAAPVSYPAHVYGQQRRVVNATGQEKMSTVTVRIGATPGVKEVDRITLPARFSVRQPPILAAQPVMDEVGVHHEVVFT